MDLAIELRSQLENPSLDASERARLACDLAREFEEAGDYQTARDCLGELWRGVGVRPTVEGLEVRACAELLLRAGVLTGWIGSANQLEGAQESAKDLISASVAQFQRLDDAEKIAEAQNELAFCYWREGAFDEARVILREVLNHLGENDGQQKAVVLLRLAGVENSATRFKDSLDILNEAAPLFESSESHALKGKFHNELATNLRDLAAAENREEYLDRALVEYTAASFHFEEAGHARYCAAVENNLGGLFLNNGRYAEAHRHLDRARKLFASLKDEVRTAQVDETRARALLGEGRNTEAERVVRAALKTLEKGGEYALLAEALTTHATALARTGRGVAARSIFARAIERAEHAGDIEGAGLAALALLEEAYEHLSHDELSETYERADQMLTRSQHPRILARLRACARRVVVAARRTRNVELPAPQTPAQLVEEASARQQKRVTFTPEALEALRREFLPSRTDELRALVERTMQAATEGASITADAVEIYALRQRPEIELTNPWADFSLKEDARRFEERYISLALKESEGRVTHAATLLGFNHPASLKSLLETKHPRLLSARIPATPRKRSIISDGRRRAK
jgi:tetratricopeptide (TPR) repeat protein